MPRLLNQAEIVDFLNRHQDALTQIHDIEEHGDIVDAAGIPDRTGKAWREPDGHYVLVVHRVVPLDQLGAEILSAKGRSDPSINWGNDWAFVDLSDSPQVARAVNNPPTVNPDVNFTQSIIDTIESYVPSKSDMDSVFPSFHPIDSITSGLGSMAAEVKSDVSTVLGGLRDIFNNGVNQVNADVQYGFVAIAVIVGLAVVLLVVIAKQGVTAPGLKIGR